MSEMFTHWRIMCFRVFNLEISNWFFQELIDSNWRELQASLLSWLYDLFQYLFSSSSSSSVSSLLFCPVLFCVASLLGCFNLCFIFSCQLDWIMAESLYYFGYWLCLLTFDTGLRSLLETNEVSGDDMVDTLMFLFLVTEHARIITFCSTLHPNYFFLFFPLIWYHDLCCLV